MRAITKSPRAAWSGKRWPQIGVSCGLLLGTGAVALSQAISGDNFETWGWRLPFLLSIVLATVGLYIRLNATESPAFLAAKAEWSASRRPRRRRSRWSSRNTASR